MARAVTPPQSPPPFGLGCEQGSLSELESTTDDLILSITWPKFCARSFSFDEGRFESVGRHWPKGTCYAAMELKLNLDDYNYELICPKLRLADRCFGLTHFPALASTTSAVMYLWVPCSFVRVVKLFLVPSTTYVCPKSIHEPVDGLPCFFLHSNAAAPPHHTRVSAYLPP